MKSNLLTDPFPTPSKMDVLRVPELAAQRPPPGDEAHRRGDTIDVFFDETLRQLREQASEVDPNRCGDSEDRRLHWRRTLAQAMKLHARLARDPRLCSFDISGDHEEISVKVAAHPPHADAYFILSRHEPDSRELPPMECVWLRQIGEPDVLFEKPLDGLRELAVRLARLLV